MTVALSQTEFRGKGTANLRTRWRCAGNGLSSRGREAARKLGLMICDHCGEPIVRHEAPEKCPRCGRVVPRRYLPVLGRGVVTYLRSN